VNESVVFATPWFDLVAKQLDDCEQPHYSIRTRDYVTTIAVTPNKQLILVRQYRPAVNKVTLEFPSGHVEDGQTPEEAARQELLEETGYIAEAFEPLGSLFPDTGRMGNRMWCFFAKHATPAEDSMRVLEKGIDTVVYGGSVSKLIAEEGFDHALNVSALFLAVLKGKFRI
jgi:ADP-ribose pyrophosphatase